MEPSTVFCLVFFLLVKFAILTIQEQEATLTDEAAREGRGILFLTLYIMCAFPTSLMPHRAILS